MPRERRRTRLPVQTQTFVQKVYGAFKAMSADAARDEFERERDAIEAAANVSHDRCIRVGERKVAVTGLRSFDKELHCRKRQCGKRAYAAISRWAFERLQPMSVFAFDTQCLATGCEDMNLRCLADDHF